MFANVTQILNNYGVIGVEVLKKAISQVEATGKTAQSLRHEVTSSDTTDTLTIYARAFFELIEKGRRPTDKGPSPEMIQFLTEYAKARGMDKPESAAWGIAKKINKEGDKTYRAGGREVYSPELLKFVDELTKVIATEFRKGFVTEIKGAFRGSSN